jgi:hypothetical protein
MGYARLQKSGILQTAERCARRLRCKSPKHGQKTEKIQHHSDGTVSNVLLIKHELFEKYYYGRFCVTLRCMYLELSLDCRE